MSGGKGGSTTSEITVPDYIENAAKANLAKADAISQVGFTPYYGCLLYTSPSPRDKRQSRMPSSA